MLLLTEWDEYAALSPADAGALVRRRTLLDARNVLDAAGWEAEGWTVRGLGRGRASRRKATSAATRPPADSLPAADARPLNPPA